MSSRKEKEMTNSQTSAQLDKTEEKFIVELKKKPAQELHNFLAGPWTASILSSDAIEELYQYQKLQQQEETKQQLTAKQR
jgi:hypothetical protein